MTERVRRASLGTLFLTVFLDLLGFGLVVPYLPGVARAYGASEFTATLLGASYALMQLVFVPLWAMLSDRVGRRPVLVGSITASVLGMVALGSATSLWVLFAARIFSGIATANLSVAQAYIADVTPPEGRARGMGMIGVGVGLGFILGPVVGGLLEAHSPLEGPGAMPAYAAAALSALNLLLAMLYLPESFPAEKRRARVRRSQAFGERALPQLGRMRTALTTPGVAIALLVNLITVLSFAGLEQTFRLYTEDGFGMDEKGTGYVLGFSGVIILLVQGGLIRVLSRRSTERTLIAVGIVIQAAGFLAVAVAPDFAGAVVILYAGMGILALGSGLTRPSLSAFVSRCGTEHNQGALLGALQSAGALGRVVGPALGGILYQVISPAAPYVGAALGMLLAAVVSLWLRLPPQGEERSAI